MNRVTQRVDEWKRKIVDLSRRNRLLYFTRTRGSTLRITEPALPEVFARLVDSEKPWKFYMPPDIPEGPEHGNESNDVQDTTQPPLLGNQEPEESSDFRLEEDVPDRGPDELLTDTKDGAKLRSVLRNQHRRSRTDFEERGVRILFLALGILEWKEVEQTEIIKSPR